MASEQVGHSDEADAIENSPTPIRVLYIEDLQAHREMIKKVMAGVKWLTLDTAETLEEGLAKIENYNVILLDLMLPGQSDCFEGLRRVIQKVPLVPVVVFTADDTRGQGALRIGATEFLPKTLDAAALVSNAIRSALTKHRHSLALGKHLDSLDNAIRNKTPSEQIAVLAESMRKDLFG